MYLGNIHTYPITLSCSPSPEVLLRGKLRANPLQRWAKIPSKDASQQLGRLLTPVQEDGELQGVSHKALPQ
jgi:hypothetical protein